MASVSGGYYLCTQKNDKYLGNRVHNTSKRSSAYVQVVSFAVVSKTGVQDMYSDLSRHIDFLNIHFLRKLACQAAVTSDAC